jgi:hypothetical protein
LCNILSVCVCVYCCRPISNVRELVEATDAFCEMDWHDVNGTYDHSMNANKGKHKKTSMDSLPHRCVEALYLSILLEEGFGFDLDQRSLTLALKVEGVEVEWTLGVLLTKALAHSTPSLNSTTSTTDTIASGNSSSNDLGSAEAKEGVETLPGEKKSSSKLNDHHDFESSPSIRDEESEELLEGSESITLASAAQETTATAAAAAAAAQETASAAAVAAVAEGVRTRVRALKAAGLPASTLKKLFPDVDIGEFFDEEEMLQEESAKHAKSERGDTHHKGGAAKSTLRSQIRGWKATVLQRVVHPVTETASVLAWKSKSVCGHAAKSFEMFAQVFALPLEYLRARSRYLGRWLYRKLFELTHNRPL